MYFLEIKLLTVGREARLRLDAKQKAEVLLDRHWQSRRAVDVAKIIAAEGIALVEEPAMVDGSVEVISGRYLIRIDARSTAVRKRFTMAHELGHIAFDCQVHELSGLPERMGEIPDRAPRYRLINSRVPLSVEERFCNWFAGFLLAPDETVSDLLTIENLTFERLESRAKMLGVSMEALAWRVVDVQTNPTGYIQLEFRGKPSDPGARDWRVRLAVFPNAQVFVPKNKSIPKSSGFRVPDRQGVTYRCEDVDLSAWGLECRRDMLLRRIGSRLDAIVLPSLQKAV